LWGRERKGNDNNNIHPKKGKKKKLAGGWGLKIGKKGWSMGEVGWGRKKKIWREPHVVGSRDTLKFPNRAWGGGGGG